MVLPTAGSRLTSWLAVCIETSCCSFVLVAIACSTWLKPTSSWVNWLVSSGDVGSWFWSCVVSILRKVVKSLPNPVVGVVVAAGAAAAGVAPVLELTVGIVIGALLSSDADVERAEMAARDGGGGDARRGVDRAQRRDAA